MAATIFRGCASALVGGVALAAAFSCTSARLLPAVHVPPLTSGVEARSLALVQVAVQQHLGGDRRLTNNGTGNGGKAVKLLLPAGARIGDMFVPPVATSDDRTQVLHELAHENDSFSPPPMCAATMKRNTRSILIGLAGPYHGSTALEGVLMSGKNLSTLCSYGKWQCEGKEIMMDAGFEERDVESWDFSKMLFLYSKYWDLKKPILFEKSPQQMLRARTVYWGIQEADLPPQMVTAGIQKLNLAYILLWRPPCLVYLSSHAMQVIKDSGLEVYARRDQKLLTLLAEHHSWLTEKGASVLVVNLADLLWRPDRTKNRIQHFMPCAGHLDVDYVPKLGIDIFPGNQWKAQGSVRAFGDTVDPKNFLTTGDSPCVGGVNPLEALSEKERMESLRAERYLRQYS